MPFDALAFFSALNATSPSRLFFSFAEEEFFSPPDPSLPAIATSRIAGSDFSTSSSLTAGAYASAGADPMDMQLFLAGVSPPSSLSNDDDGGAGEANA